MAGRLRTLLSSLVRRGGQGSCIEYTAQLDLCYSVNMVIYHELRASTIQNTDRCSAKSVMLTVNRHSQRFWNNVFTVYLGRNDIAVFSHFTGQGEAGRTRICCKRDDHTCNSHSDLCSLAHSCTRTAQVSSAKKRSIMELTQFQEISSLGLLLND
jgi:hypothetical protein